MIFKKTYRRKRHSVSLLYAHLVFVIKYRRRVITDRAFVLLRKSMQATAKALDININAIEADGDHLHIMLCYPPQLALSEIVRRLKGASSRLIRQARLPEVVRRLWGKAFWSPSYFVVSCGGAPLETVKAYIDNQQNPLRRSRKDTIPAQETSSPKPYPRTEVRGLRANL